MSNVKSVGEGVQEYRLDWGPGYRVYFPRDGDRLVVLLGGGTKKRQSADIETAKACWTAYKLQKEEGSEVMALTKDFRETIRARAQRDVKFRRALLREAIEQMLAGDIETGKAMIRNYINATVGFPALSKTVHAPPESLMRMFGPKGNPSAANLFGVIAALQSHQGIHFTLKPVRG